MIDHDIVIIGGGPAGLAAALSAHTAGARDIIVLERDRELGGILNQCIHDGFGNFRFNERLTGPEYAGRFIAELDKAGIAVKLNTMVLDITDEKTVTAVSPDDGVLELRAKAIILAMGCRERTRGQILIPGDRPAGVYTAGVAQRYLNIEGVMPGKDIVILGSGDIGLIMARRFTLEGANVKGVYEVMDHPGGLTRNIVQCLHDFDIPLHLSHTIVDIQGKERVERVVVAEVDGAMKPIKGTEKEIPCDTVILSVGLIPENELSRKAHVVLDRVTRGPVVDECMQTSVKGIFACGNVVHVHDLVDDVSAAADTAGACAAAFAAGQRSEREQPIHVLAGENVMYVVPQQLTGKTFPEDICLYFRVRSEEKNVRILVRDGENVLAQARERIVKPPEMVKIHVPGAALSAVTGDTVSVEVTHDEKTA